MDDRIGYALATRFFRRSAVSLTKANYMFLKESVYMTWMSTRENP
jgi:hypothetical protein